MRNFWGSLADYLKYIKVDQEETVEGNETFFNFTI